MLRRFIHALDNHGWRGLFSRQRGPNDFAADVQHPFDRERGTDTSGYIPGERLHAGFFNTAYYPISPSTLREALALLPEPIDGWTFVDLGCGKGRALLIAAEFPFGHLDGVELASELAGIARKNTARESRIRIWPGDARHMIYPDAPLVVFLYHPFLAPVLRSVLRELELQLADHPRRAYLLYANPSYPEVMAQFGFLQPVWDTRIPLSDEDAGADRHGSKTERYVLYRAE